MRTGWGKGKDEKKPFTRSEYKDSYIKRSIGGSYDNYLKNHKRIVIGRANRSLAQKKAWKARKNSGYGFGFKMPKLW